MEVWEGFELDFVGSGGNYSLSNNFII